VEVIAPRGQFGPELHLVLPGQPAARLWPGDVRRWWVAGLAGTEITFVPPDELRIRQYGRLVRAVRRSSPEGTQMTEAPADAASPSP
jgi:hypothetical protein